ncbi:MAG TPA: winged helix-turn-helix domain-containing protein, partial [Stellaceae bacterium]|nr:winged helix-turn-helix domain-containing protein [Stellaceae bacterium]
MMPAQGPPTVYESGECQIDLARRELRTHGALVPVGGRAFEILEVLVQSAGQLVTKDELMDRIWPGAVIEENTLQVHISAVRKALGPYRAMLKTESGRGYRMLGAWTVREDGRSTSAVDPEPPPAAPDRPFQTNFPAPASELIGRTSTVQYLRDLLSAYRVVTLTGPGGIGKTTLALDAARSLFPGFQGDGRLVELASLSDPDLVP